MFVLFTVNGEQWEATTAEAVVVNSDGLIGISDTGSEVADDGDEEMEELEDRGWATVCNGCRFVIFVIITSRGEVSWSDRSLWSEESKSDELPSCAI